MDFDNFLVETARRLQDRLGIHTHFLETLIHEADDWSFVIKTHAFLESALTHLIVVSFDKPHLADHIARMPMDGRTGKLGFIESMQLLPDEVLSFIRVLGEIRNRFAHNPKNVDLRIEDWAKAIGKDRNWWRRLFVFVDGGSALEWEGKKLDAGVLAALQPRAVVWISTIQTASVIYESIFSIENRRETEQARVRELEYIVLQQAPSPSSADKDAEGDDE